MLSATIATPAKRTPIPRPRIVVRPYILNLIWPPRVAPFATSESNVSNRVCSLRGTTRPKGPRPGADFLAHVFSEVLDVTH